MRILLCIFIMTLFASCYSQKEIIENKLMDCYYQSFTDGGIELKQLIDDYETLLINEGFLGDSSPKSYVQYLQNFANQNKFVKKPDEEKLQKCRKTILADSTNYNISKLKGVELAMTSNAKPYNTVKDILNILSKDDFKIDYYKRQAFLVFCLIDTQSGLKEIDLENLDTKNALKIILDSKSTLYVNEIEKTKEQLKIIVRNHVEQNNTKYVISLKADKEAKYKEYISFKNIIIGEIEALKNEYAIKKYNKKYENLLDNQKEHIDKIYPKNFTTLD